MSGIGGGCLWFLAASMLSAGCASTVAYDGPRLPAAEVARIVGEQTVIHIVDDDRVEDNSAEILPGEHTLTVALQAFLVVGPLDPTWRSNGDQKVCFTAFAGRRYETRPATDQSFASGHWRPGVFDKTAQVFVDHPCPVGRPHPVLARPPARPAPASTEDKPSGPPASQKTDSE